MVEKITTTLKLGKSPKNGVVRATIDLLDVTAKMAQHKIDTGKDADTLVLALPAGTNKTLGLTLSFS